MTNLLVHVTMLVVTNCFTVDNSSGCSMCNMLANCGNTMPAVYHPAHPYQGPYKEATERTDTTRVIKMEILDFKWRDQSMAITNVVSVVDSNKVSVIKKEWVEKK